MTWDSEKADHVAELPVARVLSWDVRCPWYEFGQATFFLPKWHECHCFLYMNQN